MSTHQAQIRWQRGTDEFFVDSRYSRAHEWRFDGGVVVPASSAVTSVPLPYSKQENVDPEEALVAAVSSCHMLTFLYLAAKTGLVVESYDDTAVGFMNPDSRGRLSITAIMLAPAVVLSGQKPPNDAVVARLHHDAHEECFIANSVRAQITVAGSWLFESATFVGSEP